MKAKDRYEIIVNTIENLIKENELANREIGDKAFNDAGIPMDDRSKNVLFGFLLEKSVNDYISERRLMIGYKLLIKEGENAYAKAVALANTSDESYYIKKFKDVFNRLTPKQAKKLKDASLYKTIPTWESISSSSTEGENMIDTMFGIPKEQFKMIQRALNLQDFYGLNEEESEFAYSLNEDGIDIDKAFEYIYNYLGGNTAEDRDARLEVDLSQSDVKYLYFECGFGFEQIFNILLMQYLKQFDGEIRSYDKSFLKGCSDYSQKIKYDILFWGADKDQLKLDQTYQQKCEYYKKNATEEYTELDFELYAYLLKTFDMQDAFSVIKPGIKDVKRLNRIKRSIDENDFTCDDIDNRAAGEIVESWLDTREAYEPDVWEDDYITPIEDEEEFYDEEEWYAREIEFGHDYEDEYFNVDEFERLCEDMAEIPDDDIKQEESSKLNLRTNLDVEKFWKDLTTKPQLFKRMTKL